MSTWSSRNSINIPVCYDGEFAYDSIQAYDADLFWTQYDNRVYPVDDILQAEDESYILQENWDYIYLTTGSQWVKRTAITPTTYNNRTPI